MTDSAARGFGRLPALLYAFAAAAFALKYLYHPSWGETALFFCSALGIVPLARLMGHATERIAARTGPGIGAFINAALGNAAEFIIAIVALKSGQIDLIKASLTGSIIGNVLFIVGLSFLLGGLKREYQAFSRVAAESGTALLFTSVAAISIPSILTRLGPRAEVQPNIHMMSVAVSVVLLLTYAASLVFAFRTHKHVFADEEERQTMRRERLGPAIASLLVSAVGIGFLAEFLVHTVEHASTRFGFSQTFVGVIIVAIVGNAAEHAAAVAFAMKDKMNLSMGIAIESSKQIALFVAPLLVLIGALWGVQPALNLDFTILESAGLIMSIVILALLVLDGKSNWLEGVMLLAVYAILGIAFYFSR